jgi:hypothetical protein
LPHDNEGAAARTIADMVRLAELRKDFLELQTIVATALATNTIDAYETASDEIDDVLDSYDEDEDDDDEP